MSVRGGSGVRIAALLLLTGLLSTASSCGGGPSSGLNRSARLGTLTEAEQKKLCDWSNGEQGGYGRSVSCKDGSTQGTDTSSMGCVEGQVAAGVLCPTLTVAHFEDCTTAVADDLCLFPTAKACAEIRACIDMFSSEVRAGMSGVGGR